MAVQMYIKFVSNFPLKNYCLKIHVISYSASCTVIMLYCVMCLLVHTSSTLSFTNTFTENQLAKLSHQLAIIKIYVNILFKQIFRY